MLNIFNHLKNDYIIYNDIKSNSNLEIAKQ